jgi:exopolysaccharide production protein ExoY
MIKRAFDIFFSLTLIFLLIPLFIFTALLIKLTSKGPVFYKAKRVKKNFKLFTCYKFRTMYKDADLRLYSLLKADPKLLAEWQTYEKLKKDPRITPIGSFLRKSSMDELPQLWNVLKGDMSIVGPRPYAMIGKGTLKKEDLINLYGKEMETILKLKPGLTGLWQVSGRNELPVEKRVELDLIYSQNQSLRLDLIILAKTVPKILTAKGAY